LHSILIYTSLYFNKVKKYEPLQKLLILVYIVTDILNNSMNLDVSLNFFLLVVGLIESPPSFKSNQFKLKNSLKKI
jgi:hypothetical protein